MQVSRLRHFIRYLLRATGPHGVHSPFVYELCTRVLPSRRMEGGEAIEYLRREMLRSEESLTFTDLGAGSVHTAKESALSLTVAQSLRNSARRRVEGELLARISSHYRPTLMLELGTHLGISGSYMQMGNPGGRFITVEGAAAFAQKAEESFAALGFSPRVINASFEEALQRILQEEKLRPDLVFLDGHHSYGATLAYARQIIPAIADGGLLILDDIYWSGGMQKAWNEICALPEVTVSIDLFVFGICYIRRPQAKEHFTLRFLPF